MIYSQRLGLYLIIMFGGLAIARPGNLWTSWIIFYCLVIGSWLFILGPENEFKIFRR